MRTEEVKNVWVASNPNDSQPQGMTRTVLFIHLSLTTIFPYVTPAFQFGEVSL